jgi:hypothetical protein
MNRTTIDTETVADRLITTAVVNLLIRSRRQIVAIVPPTGCTTQTPVSIPMVRIGMSVTVTVAVAEVGIEGEGAMSIANARHLDNDGSLAPGQTLRVMGRNNKSSLNGIAACPVTILES